MASPPRLLAAVLVALLSCTSNGDPVRPPVSVDGGPTVSARSLRVACALPRSQLVKIRNGFRPGRSGNLQIVAQPPNYFGNHLHSGPWPYLQRVPLLLYGPGHIASVGTVARPATMADVAPTFARLLRFPFEAPDGRPIPGVTETAAAPPRLILTLVWDGAGRNVLDEWADAWPTLRRLAERGAWLENFTVGSSPSVTPAIHATLGTGAFPETHGIVDLRFLEDGAFADSRFAPRYLLVPTLGDVYDRARGNRPIVGSISEQSMLGMLGRGTLAEGADRDLALAPKGASFALVGPNADLFRFPTYVSEVPGLEEAVRRLDLEDGRLDNLWMDANLEDPGSVSLTPAFAEWQTDVVGEVIRRERFGADEVPDLLYVNYKGIDKVGHRFSMNSPQAEAAVAATDRALGELVRTLDEEVGEGEWVLGLTADHGSTPDASVTGAFNIDILRLTEDVQARFDVDDDDRPVVRSQRITQMWIDEAELAQGGFTLDDVARFLMGYRAADNVDDPSTLAEDDRDRRVFSAAFPSAALRRLPCLEGRT